MNSVVRWLALLAPLWPVFGACLAGDAGAEVIRCLDAAGNITYQDVPCEPGQAARSVTLPPAESRDSASAWEAAARDARVIKGMPKRWVIRARGTPVEIRPGTASEAATEIWRYAGRDGALVVGFAGPDVAWVRDDGARKGEPAEVARKSEPVPATPVPETTRGPQNRRFVIVGRYCEHVVAEIGSPDRQESLPGPEGGVRYFYEPQPGDPQMRTAFSCIRGKIADVERTVVR